MNMVVTNVPGPPFPLYLLGARLEAIYPLVPLLEHCGLGIALFSYDGALCWGFNASYELVPDLEAFVGATEESFRELSDSFGIHAQTPRAAETESRSHAARGFLATTDIAAELG
jgi:hypothetical protein